MNRDYQSGKSDSVIFFKGCEVEKTPAHGLQTLFVTGVQTIEDINIHIGVVKHIFFGANHSFDPKNNSDWEQWNKMIQHYLDAGYLCSLDIPINLSEMFLQHSSTLVSCSNFIPQLRVPIPHIVSWNNNLMIKIDDKGFNESNPGVWCHTINSLLLPDSFTGWEEYKNDEIL